MEQCTKPALDTGGIPKTKQSTLNQIHTSFMATKGVATNTVLDVYICMYITIASSKVLIQRVVIKWVVFRGHYGLSRRHPPVNTPTHTATISCDKQDECLSGLQDMEKSFDVGLSSSGAIALSRHQSRHGINAFHVQPIWPKYSRKSLILQKAGFSRDWRSPWVIHPQTESF